MNSSEPPLKKVKHALIPVKLKGLKKEWCVKKHGHEGACLEEASVRAVCGVCAEQGSHREWTEQRGGGGQAHRGEDCLNAAKERKLEVVRAFIEVEGRDLEREG